MKKTNKIISILLVLAMLLSMAPLSLTASAAPDTDYTGYYKLTNAGNLAWFACLVVGDTSQSGITEAVPDAKAVLTADIDITVLAETLGKSWVGIGTEEIPFTGVFDGNGYTIKGLTTDTSLTKSSVATVAVDSEKQGLFGVIGEGGVVRDVIVEGTANLSDTIKYGGICSENNGTIENVLSMITVTGGDNADVFCHTNNGTITNSFANQTTSVASGVTTVDAAALADGSVTHALGDSFGQIIGTDTQPVHFNGSNKVYRNEEEFTNTKPETPAFSGGTGIKSDPFLLATADDLVTLKDFVISGGADTLDDADNCGLGAFHGYYFKMIKDIDMSGVEEWIPFNFNGTFDGAGHTISNMQMNENFFESADPANNEYKSAEYEAAFFGQVVHATIKNLYFDNCTVEISDGLDPSSSRDIYVGIVATTAIASCFENISATNCTVIQNGKDDNFAYSGGLVGYADTCHFEYCSFDGTITTGGDATGSQCAGGLIGGWGDMYYEYIADYGNPFNMVVGAGKDFGIYNSFSTAEINNPYFYSSAGIVGYLCTDFIPAEIENCAFGGKITAGGRAAGIMGEGEKDDYYIDCIVYAEEITTSNVAYALGMNATEVTNCKLSDKTVISGTKETQLNGLTPVTLATDEEKIENFKSNLHGKLADGMADVKITLSQNDEVKYTAVTDADGEFNFGKQVLRGEYILNIAESDAAEAYETEITIDYATNHKLDVTRVIKHTHSFTYTASGDTITAVCTAEGCILENGDGGYITISAPADLYVDGNAKEAVVDNQLADTSVTYEVTYSTADGSAPKTAGTYTASVTLGDATASVEFTLLNFAASVTDKDGKLIGNYTTFADAITAAKNSAGSTLTLLDNTEGVYAHIVSPVTLDLNGYTLDMGNNNILVGSVLTGYDPHVTLTDTSEAGTGKIKGSNFYGVFNVTYSDSPGKLTVQGGTIEYTGTQGAISLRQNGATVEMSGGSIKSTASTISIANYQEDFDGSVNISGGSFPDGLKIQVNSTDYTSTEQYLADLLAEGYAFYNENGNKITVADDATEITGYVQVKEYFAASVTNKNGSTTNYKTLADAVTAAQGSEGSTLTLLDDITLTAIQYISSGKFTLDLNGKTLFNETATTLWIESGADVTIKDSGEGGTVKSNAASSSAILNNGTLTVESGNIISENEAVENNRTLTVNGGSFEGKKYALYIPKGTTEIYGGEFNGTVWGFAPYTINDGDFTAGHIGINCEGGVLTVNGGTFDIDEIKIYKGTVSLSGGEFKNGFTVYDLKYDSDAEQFAATFLADGYYYKDADGKIITVADDAKAISGYAKVAKGADFANDAVITLSQTEYEYNGGENKPAVTVTVGGKTLDSANYTVSYADNINAGTATVTVTAVESDIYSGTATANFTITKAEISVTAPAANTLTYNGSAQALITAGSANIGKMQYSTDGVEYSATIPTATNAGDYTVYYKVVGDANYNDTEPATVSVTIKTKDISDAFIILGDALTYTGEEQTQTVTTVEIPDDLDVTYNISGNKATNVGVYLLTVTGTGNFSGEAKIAYEIAPDTTSIDALTTENVTSADKASIEAVKAQIDNAVTDLADDEKKAEYQAIADKCVELLKVIESVENQIVSFNNELAKYDINTVTSDDNDALVNLYDSVNSFTVEYNDNLTDDEKDKCAEISAAIADLTRRIGAVGEEITRITDAVNGYDKATIKSSDKADLEQLIADINALTTGKNITDTERADLLALADTVNELLTVISDTANEINRINDAVDAYNIETVTSADKSDIEKLIEDIKVLTDGGNITDAEREQLNGNETTLIALGNKIAETADEIARIENAVNGYDEATVKSTDKADIEKLIEDIKALTDATNITDTERTNLENFDATADALLAKIAETMSEYDRVIAAANGYDEATVTSADKDTLVQLNDDIYTLALTDNVTAEELENLENAHDKILGLIDKLTGISDEIKRIIEAVDKYVFESVKSSDMADIQQLIEDIKALLDTQNITADERTLLEGADETCDKLVAKIDETVAEINRINDATNAYDIDTVTSADKADVEKLIEDIKVLTDGDNITDTEREQLDGNETTLSALLDKIGATADEIARIENAVNGYDEATVKSTDKADLEQLVEDIKALTDATNITAEEKAALEALDETADSLIKKIDDTAAEIARIDEAVNAYDEETVKSSDIQALGKLIEDIKALTDGDNITEDEKAALEADDAAVDALVEKLTEVAEEIKRVDEAVKSYDEKTIKSSDSEDLAQLKEDIQALIDSTNTTENEKTALGEMIKDIEALEDKIDETAKEIERIENAVNGYDEETVKSSDEEAINKLKEDIQTLIDSGNVTEEEIAALEDTKADADALTDKIDETQTEIDRINEAVAGYDEDKVKSSDEEAINKLKEDIKALVDSGNVTEEEIAALEDTKADADALTDKITETEEQLEEIAGIENGYAPETVTSDDKADIEAAIAEIEAVNPDNLTDEQKAEYDEIKAEFEALLEEIEAAEKSVADIGVELEMFDENRVTIFWEDDIEAFKAKIDELLADENMGTAEKAKLNEYKAQAEKLIEIINTPKEYFSLRFFYFIWDCLTWKYNGILWLFSNLFGC